MIKRFEEDKDKEFDFIKENLSNIEKEFSITEDIKDSYLYDFQWILDHIDSNCKNTIKRLNKINSELIQHIKGFTLLIRNQDNKELKEEMIQSFIDQVRKNNLQLKEIEL